MKTRVVTPEQARRIAVRAQLLDGSANSVLDTVRKLGHLQMDPIATVARPQELVLFSRLGPFDCAELDRERRTRAPAQKLRVHARPAASRRLARTRLANET